MASSCCQRSSGGSFLFGLFLGAIIGAVIAIVLYRHQRGRVISLLKKQFKEFLSPPPSRQPKKKVALPPRLFSKKK